MMPGASSLTVTKATLCAGGDRGHAVGRERLDLSKKRVHVCLHALLIFIRPVSAGFLFIVVSWLRNGSRLAFPLRLSRANF